MEYLARGKGGAILYVQKERGEEISMLSIDVVFFSVTHLVITNQPDSGCLIIFIVGDHDIVCPDLEEVAFRWLYGTKPQYLVTDIIKIRTTY